MFNLISENENTSVGNFGSLTHQAFNANSRAEIFSTRDFQNKLIKEIGDFSDGGGKLLSFDVFDTILLRNNKSEIRRFYEISDLFSKAITETFGAVCSAEGVLFARYVSTKNSYEYSEPVQGCREGWIEEIHLGIARMLNIDDGFSEKFTEIEINYERQNIEPNLFIQPVLDLCQRLGLGVVLISDMYMGRSHIINLLNSHFPDTFQVDQIFSSGDLKISKRSGHLFDYVSSEVGVARADILHIGDNLVTDYNSARARGVRAIYLPHSDSEYDAINSDELATINRLLDLGIDLKTIIPY